jgi:hypothetical protein
MNGRQLIYVLMAVAILVVAGVVLNHSQKQGWRQNAGPGKAVLGSDLPVNSVVKVTIADKDASLTLEKKNGVWRVAERYGYAADYGKVGTFMRDLVDLRAAQEVAVGESQYGRLQVIEPGNPGESGTKVDFYDESGQSLWHLILGKEHLRKSAGDNPMMGGGWPDGRYLRIPQKGAADRVVLVNKDFRSISPVAKDWLDKEFVKIGDLKSGALVRDGQEVWRVERVQKDDTLKLAGLKEGEEADADKLQTLGGAFGYASFQDVADPKIAADKTGLDKPAVYTATDFDGLVYTLKFGAKADGNYYMSAAVEAKLPLARPQVKDEKPEDKQNLDAEFAAKNEQARRKAEDLQKRLVGWIYLVPAYTAEQILKTRDELIKPPQKDEESADQDEGTLKDDAAK